MPGRIGVVLHAGALDRRLRAGEPIALSGALERRARAITAGRPRRALAQALKTAALSARRPLPPGIHAHVRAQQEAGDAAFGAVRALAARLRDEDPLPRPQGVALARRLATDGTAELWCPHAPCALHDAVLTALEACDAPVGPDAASTHSPAR